MTVGLDYFDTHPPSPPDRMHPLDILVRMACDPEDSYFASAWQRKLSNRPDAPPIHPMSPMYATDADIYTWTRGTDPPEHRDLVRKLDEEMILEAVNHPAAFFRIVHINKMRIDDPLADQDPSNLGPADPTPAQMAVLMRGHALFALRSIPEQRRRQVVLHLGLGDRLDHWHIVGKCRQAMMSTVVALGIILRDAMYFRGLQCVIAANTEPVAKELFRRIRIAWKNLPPELQMPLMPGTQGSETQMTFVHGGFIKVMGLGGPSPGIGHAVDRGLLSEWGEVVNQAKASSGIFPAFNQRKNAVIYLESTWGMAGSDHQQKWFASLDGEGRFHPIFVRWWLLPGLTRQPPSGFKRTAEEEALATIIRNYCKDEIDDSHLYYRRVETATTFKGRFEQFDRKYPPSPVHGWVSSGFALMPTEKLSDMLLHARAHEDALPGPGGIAIFTDREVGEAYAVIADTAGYAKFGDASALTVIRLRDGREVAAWKGRVEPERMADIVQEVAAYFSMPGFPCVIVIERNAPGTIAVLRDREVLGLWHDEDGLPGWKASGVTVPRATGRLAQALLDGHLKPVSQSGLLQLSQYDGSWKKRIRSIDDEDDSHHFDLARCYVIAADVIATTPFKIPKRASNASAPSALTDAGKAMRAAHAAEIEEARARGANMVPAMRLSDAIDEAERARAFDAMGWRPLQGESAAWGWRMDDVEDERQ